MSTESVPQPISSSVIPEYLRFLVVRAEFLSEFFLYTFVTPEIRPQMQSVLGEQGDIPTWVIYLYNKWAEAVAVVFLWSTEETWLEDRQWYDSDTWVFPEKGAGFYAIIHGNFIKLAGVNMLGTCRKGIGPVCINCQSYKDLFNDSVRKEISRLLIDIFSDETRYRWEKRLYAVLRWKPL